MCESFLFSISVYRKDKRQSTFAITFISISSVKESYGGRRKEKDKSVKKRRAVSGNQ